MISLSEIGGLYMSVPANLKDARAKAFSDACDRQIKKLMERAEKTKVWCAIEQVDERHLDYLAADCRAQFYHSGHDLAVKRNLIKNSMCWYMGAGTKQAMDGLVTAVFGDGKIEEWFEYGGRPYHFRVNLMNVEVDHGQDKEFRRMLATVKRLGAQLDSVQYIFCYEAKLLITYDANMRITSAFYPRSNVPLHRLDGTTRLEGGYPLNGYLSGETLDFYPVLLQVRCGVGHAGLVSAWSRTAFCAAATQDVRGSAAVLVRGAGECTTGTQAGTQIAAGAGESGWASAAGHLRVEKAWGTLDGSRRLDGGRRLDAAAYGVAM